MRLPRIYSAQALSSGESLTLDSNATRHLVQVLRLKAGNAIILFDGSGNDFSASISLANKRECIVQIDEVVRHEQSCKLSLHLAIGISRGERMDFSIQKAVELGVQSITPLFTERCMVQLKGERLKNRLTHWQGVVHHACEQSGRSLVPQIHTAQPLNSWLERLTGTSLILDHRAEDTLATIEKPEHALTLLVGPEGGLSTVERQQATRQGMLSIRLGPRVLRTETAPLAALAAIQMLWGDFR